MDLTPLTIAFVEGWFLHTMSFRGHSSVGTRLRHGLALPAKSGEAVSTTRRSLIFSFLDRYGTAGLNLAGTLLLARLLSPRDFGIYSVAISAVALVGVVRDFGVGNFLLQTRDTSDIVVRTAFTISLPLSGLCAAVLIAASDWISRYYAEPAFVGLVPLLAAGFVLVPFGMPSTSLLQRDMEFSKLATINLAYAATGLAASVVLAVLGFGYMSFAWASLLASLVRIFAALAWRPCFWAFLPAMARWREVAIFGGYASATAIVNVFHDSLPQLIIGRMLGFGAVGVLGRAASVCQLPDRLFTSALQPVLLPSFAEQARRTGDLKSGYLKSIAYMTALQWPILLCLAILADPAVELLLGAQWTETAPLVRIMALASMSLFPAFLTYPVLVAAGAIRDTLVSSLLSIAPSVVLIYLAAGHGLQAVAATQFITGPLQVWIALIFIRRHVKFEWSEFIRPLFVSGVVALCSSALPAAITLAEGLQHRLPYSLAMLAGVGAAVGWLFGLLLTGHPLLAELQRIIYRASVGRAV
jgi:O-antigen/teichoic acid export membrane protein